MTGIFQHFDALQQAIEFSQASQRLNGQNLANVNTPGYRAQEVPFEQLLSRLNGDSSLENAEFVAQETGGLPVRADGNNVDLDRELANMRKNAMAYQALTQLLGSKIGILKQAIEG